MARTVNQNATISDGIAIFDETIAFKTYMVFDTQHGSYTKKETSLNIVLFSKRKPKEENFIGRVTIDLADVINGQYLNANESKL